MLFIQNNHFLSYSFWLQENAVCHITSVSIDFFIKVKKKLNMLSYTLLLS